MLESETRGWSIPDFPVPLRKEIKILAIKHDRPVAGEAINLLREAVKEAKKKEEAKEAREARREAKS